MGCPNDVGTWMSRGEICYFWCTKESLGRLLTQKTPRTGFALQLSALWLLWGGCPRKNRGGGRRPTRENTTLDGQLQVGLL